MQTQYGRPEGAAVAYNPHQRGRKSFHPLLAVAAGTRLCPYYRFRNGDTVTATQRESAMEECQSWLGPARVWLNRGDFGLGHERVCAWHEAQAGRPYYRFRLKFTANVKRAIAAVPQSDWQGPARLGEVNVWQVIERYRQRAAEDAASQRQRPVVGAVAGRLPAGVRVAGGNCAAVEKRTAGHAHPTPKRPRHHMKTQPPTAESRFNGPAEPTPSR